MVEDVVPAGLVSVPSEIFGSRVGPSGVVQNADSAPDPEYSVGHWSEVPLFDNFAITAAFSSRELLNFFVVVGFVD